MALAVAAIGQAPQITPKGLVNSASFATDTGRGAVVLPGWLSTLFGSQFAESAQAATGFPLPTTLGGVSVTVGGLPAPLLYVSQTQINFQAPSGIRGVTVPVVVRNRFGESQPITAFVAYDAPGIFTQGGTGCGQGAILNVAPDGSVTVNSPQSSASPGQYISIFATGLETPTFPPADGVPAGGEPLSRVSNGWTYVGSPGNTPFLVPSFAGLAPGLVGVGQINVRLPEDAPEGCAIPAWIRGTTVDSQPVAIAIRRGGGPCVKATVARSGKLAWKRTITTGPENDGVKVDEVFSATFVDGESSWLIPGRPPRLGVWATAGGRSDYAAPRCGSYFNGNNSAGELTIQSATGSPFLVKPQLSGQREYVYRSALSSGSIAPGTLTVSGAGTETVGPFRTSISPPPPIEVLTDFRPGTAIGMGKALTITWRNGRQGDLVLVRLRSGYGLINPSELLYSGLAQYVPAESGTVTLETRQLVPGHFELPLIPSDRFSVVVSHIPGSSVPFRAPGMTFDATHEWEYEFQFLGLRLGGVSP
ncbi:MAG: hypothetical protein JNM66_04560 [Bryobacterales bacterium]|nr:hypothetical protein [Bryobacterales bacterium]